MSRILLQFRIQVSPEVKVRRRFQDAKHTQVSFLSLDFFSVFCVFCPSCSCHLSFIFSVWPYSMFSVHLFVKAWQRQVQAILASKLGIPKLQVQSNGKMPKYKIITVKYWQWCKTLLSNILFHQLHPKGLSVTRQRFQPAWKGRYWRILFFHVVFPLWLCDPNSTQSARTSGRKSEFSTLCIKNHSFIFVNCFQDVWLLLFRFFVPNEFRKKKKRVFHQDTPRSTRTWRKKLRKRLSAFCYFFDKTKRRWSL